jgi:hypothetical protein
MVRNFLGVALFFLALPSLGANQLCNVVSGAVLIAQDPQNTKLGNVTNSYDSDSIFNEYGTYGSQYSSSSIWNEYGTFGSEYSQYSPFNAYSSNPPMIIKQGQIIGYLSANKRINNSVTPNLLKALCEDEL